MSYEITRYNKATGEILSVDLARQSTLMWLADAGIDFLFGAGNSKLQYVVDGALVDYTADEAAALANLAPGWVWQLPERKAVDMRTQAEARAMADGRVNAERDRRIAAFDRFTFNAVLYDGDVPAQRNIDLAARRARADKPLPPGFTWRSFDNSDVPLSNADILALEDALTDSLSAHTFEMHAIARALKDAAAGDLTNTEIDAITWPE